MKLTLHRHHLLLFHCCLKQLQQLLPLQKLLPQHFRFLPQSQQPDHRLPLLQLHLKLLFALSLLLTLLLTSKGLNLHSPHQFLMWINCSAQYLSYYPIHQRNLMRFHLRQAEDHYLHQQKYPLDQMFELLH